MRILLCHWKEDELAERAGRLSAAGHEVLAIASMDGPRVRQVRAHVPEIAVIDLSRLPSHGRNAALWLRQQKVTRDCPIVFVDGTPEKVKSTRDVFPGETYTEWRRIRSAVRSAAKAAPSSPVGVSQAAEFYVDTPLQKKLGLRVTDTLALLGAPKGFDETLGGLPESVKVKRRATGRADLVLLFVRSAKELEKRFEVGVRTMGPKGSIWFVWPKRASGVSCDLTQASVRAYGLARGIVDYKVASIDATWTGLRFTRRKA